MLTRQLVIKDLVDGHKWARNGILSFGSTLSKDQIVIFLDGNKENFDPDNLAVVTRKELMILNHEKMLTADKDLSKTGVLVAKLKMKIKEKENG